jgi:hypothetical protein
MVATSFAFARRATSLSNHDEAGRARGQHARHTMLAISLRQADGAMGGGYVEKKVL